MDAIVLAGLKGFAVGFSIAAPVGPIGLLCIRGTLAGGWPLGFSTGMGAATADMVYGLLAAAGLTAGTGFPGGARPPPAFPGGPALVRRGAPFLRPPPPRIRAGPGSHRPP